jgi:hypothetical protein
MDSTLGGTVQYTVRWPRFPVIYNTKHRQCAGPDDAHDIHNGLAEAMWQHRAAVLRAAYAVHPERFPRGMLVPPPLPTAASINKPLAYVVRRIGRIDLMHS